MSVEKKVRAFIKEQKLIEKGDRILLGLSGGADSVCLFYLLLGFREEFDFELRAVHVHHGIRPEAEEDAAYVVGLCEKEGIRCLVFREDVPVWAKERGLGEEEAGRMLRYMDFETCLKSWQEENGEEFFRFKAATAHHENDQAETVLFQLFRGCGLAGLRGILPKRDRIIRPLLCLSRKEIEQFLSDRGATWREDETNQAEEYSRNKI
ncbi:MAG: tRNA lysidine(34) synthetase TilS, partial [Lachnospiraceae bacterium]|nr:tRNA lysidine(34) synthetase TilS [Lachnospiraceae bacterium]